MKCKIVADESVDFRIVLALRKSGFEVYAISEQLPSLKDESVLHIAFQNEALLITEDKDFGELVFRLHLPHKGILLIRIENRDLKIMSVVATIEKYFDELRNKFSVINHDKLRIKD